MVHLIWWFGNFGFNRQTKCAPTLIIVTCIMSISQGIYTLNITLIPKLNVRQFALHSNSPNFLMITTYCVLWYSFRLEVITDTDYALSLSLLCFQIYLLFLPEFPIIFTHYSYFIPMPSPIIPVTFFKFLFYQ